VTGASGSNTAPVAVKTAEVPPVEPQCRTYIVSYKGLISTKAEKEKFWDWMNTGVPLPGTLERFQRGLIVIRDPENPTGYVEVYSVAGCLLRPLSGKLDTVFYRERTTMQELNPAAKLKSGNAVITVELKLDSKFNMPFGTDLCGYLMQHGAFPKLKKA